MKKVIRIVSYGLGVIGLVLVLHLKFFSTLVHAQGSVMSQTFETGTSSVLPAGWTLSDSLSWGGNWGENKGSARITTDKNLELIGHSGPDSFLQLAKKIDNIEINQEYSLEVPVFIPEGDIPQGNSRDDVSVLIQGWRDGALEQFILRPNVNLKNQWQIMSGNFTLTTSDPAQVYVVLRVETNHKAIFKSVKIDAVSFDFSTGTPGTLPANWTLGFSDSTWGTGYTQDLGSAEVQDKISKSGKALEVISRNSQFGVKSSAAQVCTPLTLTPGKSYTFSGSVFVPLGGVTKSMPEMLIQQATPPYSHVIVFNPSKKGKKIDMSLRNIWQELSGDFSLPTVSPILYQLCLRANNDGDYIFDDINLQEITALPTSTPTLTITPTVTVSPPVSPVPGCLCNADDTCATVCTFDKFATPITYTDPIKCSLSSSFFANSPSTENKTSWCQKTLRTKGDTDGNGTINNTDYFYYVAAVNGGKIPVTANPDFNGDGEVGASDRMIIVKSLNL
jgi:hypothetical protein